MMVNADGEMPELMMAEDMDEALLRKSQTGGSDAFLQEIRPATFLQMRNIPEKVRERRAEELKKLDENALRKIHLKSGRCSALVKLEDQNSDLFVGHTTFSDYTEMLRVLKNYDFSLNRRGGASKIS